MPNQVDGALVHAMSGTELSRVRTEFRLRPPEPANHNHSSRGGRHCYAIKWFINIRAHEGASRPRGS
jgi:hypothetical protein